MKNDKKPIKLKRRLFLAKNQKVPDRKAAMIKLCRLYSMPLKEFFRGHNDKYQKFIEYTDGRFDINKTYGEVCRVLSKEFFDGYSKFFLKENTQCFETCSYITKPLNAIENLADAMVETEKSGDCTMLPQNALFFTVRLSLRNYIDAVNGVLTDENNHLDVSDYAYIGKSYDPLTQVLRNIRTCAYEEYSLINNYYSALNSGDKEQLVSVLQGITEHSYAIEESDSKCSYILSFAPSEPEAAIKALRKRYFGLIYALYRLIIQPFGYTEGLNFPPEITNDLDHLRFKNDAEE